MIDPLTRLAVSYGTDKYGYHDYTPNYYRLFQHLRRKPIRLLEIGVGGYQDSDRGGESLEVWRDFFPKGQIVGIDIQKKEMNLGERVTILQGSQVDAEFLTELVRDHGPFDIIIDDGSHRNEHVVESFGLLFPGLAAGGIYVAEDVQTSFFPRFGGSLELTAPNSVGHFAEILQEFDIKGRAGLADLTTITRFHNIISLHKSGSAPDINTLLKSKKKSAVRLLEIGGSEKSCAAWRKNFPDGKVVKFATDAKRWKSDSVALKKLAHSEGPFDVVIDNRQTRDEVTAGFKALYPGMADKGIYAVSGGKSGGVEYFSDLFVAVEHREIVVNFPDAKLNPLAKIVYSMTRTPDWFVMEKAANDYPSNFGFEFDNPQAVVALDAMDKILTRCGKERGYLLYTDIMTRAGDTQKVAKMLKKLDKIGASSRPYYNAASRQARVDKDWGTAMTLLNCAVKAYPNDYRIRSQLGSIYSKERDWENAHDQFEAGIELAPRDPLLRIQIANVLSRIDRVEDAVTSASKAVELAPTNAGHHVQLGRMQIDAGQFLEAIATLEKAVGINAEIPNVHRQLSRAYECLGQDAEAMKMAKEALKLYPENREYQRWQDKLAAV